MKKVLLTAVAVFAFSFANAQDTKYGVKGGLNMSNNSADGSKSITSFHLGGFAQFKMNDIDDFSLLAFLDNDFNM